LPPQLFNTLDFSITDLEQIHGSLKAGIRKQNWSNANNDFVHIFPPGTVGYHFNATMLQEWIVNKVENNNKLKIIHTNVKHDDIDCDYIIDCSGKPQSYDNYHQSEYIPVNSVYVTQCFCEGIQFEYTLAIARPYGWVFGIPLGNRCSIGYLYNDSINTLDEVKEDVKHIFKDFNLTPSDVTNSFSFNNYFRKQNYSDRVCYNGNASFFLEPLEATSINFMLRNNYRVNDLMLDVINVDYANEMYLKEINQIQNIIMLHYLPKSTFDTKFWDFSYQRASYLNNVFQTDKDLQHLLQTRDNRLAYGTWGYFAFQQNLLNLGIKVDEGSF
jgi:hypothetical protein